MPAPLTGWVWVDLGQKSIEVNGENAKICAVAPMDGTVMEVRIGQTTLHASGGGSMTIYKQAGTVTTNLLSAASVDLSAGTLGVGAAQTLTTSAASLKVSQNNLIVANYALTTAVTSVVSCIVAIEPAYW